tara:strand:- start:1584 stop:2288 length:705 start_codon:yes stop_codon:yes gene_type:complete
MALPKLNSVSYETTIPSTGKKVSFRPYLVKEEKVLMMALESNDQKQIVKATKEMISSCVLDDINVNKLATFDIESLFLQLRSKSVGESVGLKVKCDNCETQNDVTVDFNDIGVEVPEDNNVVMITDTVGIEMRYPSFDDVSSIDPNKEESIETAFDIIMKCIVSVFDDDGVYTSDNEGEKQMKEFIESLNTAQFQKVSAFFEDMPALKTSIQFKCVNCGTENETELRGLQSFFT